MEIQQCKVKSTFPARIAPFSVPLGRMEAVQGLRKARFERETLLLVVRLALVGAEVVIEDVCASSTSSPSDSSKNSFPTSSAIYVTDRVLKQLVKNLVFTFEFISREKCAVLRVVGLYQPVYMHSHVF